MLRKVALSLAVAAAFSATNANALGLGEINVTSALNEPLTAQIQLLQVKDLSPMQIQPRLANIDDYSLAGLSKSQFLQDVRFEVRVKPDGTGVIDVHTNRAIKEPFLNLLLEVNWPDGRLVREYTLLLDPPAYDPSRPTQRIAPAQSTAASSQASAPSAKSSSTPTTSKRSAPVHNIRTDATKNKTEFYVDVKDTLWGVAMKYRPDKSVSGEQMMLALQRKNPQAFPSGNINMMRAGVVMKIPTLEEIRSVSKSQAKAEVKRQTRDWREGRTGNKSRLAQQEPQRAPAPAPEEEPLEQSLAPQPVSERAPMDVSDTRSMQRKPETDGSEVSSRLQVVSSEEENADQSKSSDSGDQSAAGTPDMAEDNAPEQPSEVSQRLNSIQDNVSSLQRTNEDLTQQLKQMTDTLQSLQGALSARDQQFKNLQDQLRKEQESSDLNMPVMAALGGALVALVLAVLALLKGGRKRKAGKEEAAPESGGEAATAAVAGAAAGAAAVAVAEETQEEENVDDSQEPEPLAPLSGMDDADTEDDTDSLADLDLNMDLDLDTEENDPLTPLGESSDLDDFDASDDDLSSLAGLDDLDEPLDVTETLEPEPETSVEESLDDLLGEQDEPLNVDEEPVENLMEQLDEQPEDEPLDFSVAEPEMTEPEPEPEEDSGDDLAGLDFDIDLPEVEEDTADVVPDQEEDENALEFSTEPLTLDDEEETAGLDVVADEGTDEDDSAIDPELESLLANDSAALDDDETPEAPAEAAEETTSSNDDLDELLASFDPDDENSAESQRNPTQGEKVERELTANIAHDLEEDLDSELDEMLSSTDDEIALEDERGDTDSGEDDFADTNLLEGADESETKLDLARAYIEMDDKDGARDILTEVMNEGNHFQRREAQRLIESLES